ncbi:hypothetical protein KSB_61300 [Ktedonobacter robiniae]|uniref:Uncharacterized protein n=1 Tax=Ktedonobacter robiniae TaxID=2778365 RepID=A0ABQ3UZE3_9CHLR|nr:hypothetical protein KSB_61300 [Ktedonobacter robiniae]
MGKAISKQGGNRAYSMGLSCFCANLREEMMEYFISNTPQKLGKLTLHVALTTAEDLQTRLIQVEEQITKKQRKAD